MIYIECVNPNLLLGQVPILITIERIIYRNYFTDSKNIYNLKRHIEALPGVMFLFDEVTAGSNNAFVKLEMLRRIHDETHVPIAICGVPLLHKTIYASNRYDHYCSLMSRMDEHEMHGMRRSDAGSYIEMVAQEENVRFSYPAQQALITTALNSVIGGILAFTTIHWSVHHACQSAVLQFAWSFHPRQDEVHSSRGSW